jgi:hypothetical protein
LLQPSIIKYGRISDFQFFWGELFAMKSERAPRVTGLRAALHEGTVSLRNIAAIVAFVVLGVSAHAAPSAQENTQAIQSFGLDSMARIIASQDKKPFVLVVWSLDCPYCQASFQSLAAEKRKRRDFRVVTLSTDSVSDAQAVAQMKAKLALAGMSGNAWAYGDLPSEQLQYAIDPTWHGEKPRSYWFNAKGERVAHSGVITAALIAKLSPRAK